MHTPNIPYLKLSSKGFYKYRRRTPKPLLEYIDSAEVIKSLGSDDSEALTKAISLNRLLDEAVELTKIQSIPRDTILKLLNKELKVSSSAKANNPTTLKHFSTLYLEQSEVTPDEYSYREYFFTSFFPLVVEVLFKKRIWS